MNKHFLNMLVTCASVTLCGVLFLGTSGCGGDDDDNNATDSGLDAATGGGGTTSGAGGTTADRAGAGGDKTGIGGDKGGAGGTTVKAGAGGGSAGAGGSTVAVTCGGKTCAGSVVPGVTACCVNGGCGLGTADACTASSQAGTLDSNCPDHTITAYNTTIKGCCRPDGKCGEMFTQTGLGCVERTAVPTWADGPLTAKTCTAADSGI
jgi:hypothetical protein